MREKEEKGLVGAGEEGGRESCLTGCVATVASRITLPVLPYHHRLQTQQQTQQQQRRELTWPFGSLLGGRVLAFGLDGRGVEDAREGAVLAEMFLQTFDGSIQLTGADLVVNVHEV